MIKRIVAVAYLVSFGLILLCVPLSGIFLTVRICTGAGMPWLACCIPLMIAMGTTPVLIVSKMLIEK